jgi:diacylglycerol O-acyltransferase / wax synthase
VDGVSGIELLMMVLDVSQTPIPPIPPSEPIEKEPQEPPVQRWFEAVLDNMNEQFNRFSDRQKLAVDAAMGEVRPRAMMRAAETSLPYAQVPVVRAPFNRRFTGARRAAFSEYSFQEIRQVRAAVGGTVNDVVLTVLGGAMSRYLEMHGQSISERNLRVLTPVNIRRDDERGALGNRVSMLLVEVPLGVSDPVERLEIVRKRTESLKRRNVADGVEGLGEMFNTAPPALQQFLGTLPTPPNTYANMVCTNVPGPMIPLYSLGHRLTAHYPLIPLGWEMGISLGVTSYDQRLFFGYMADAEDGSDVRRLKEFSDQAYVELRNAAGVTRSDLPSFGAPAKEEPAATPSRRRRAAPSAVQALAADAG